MNYLAAIGGASTLVLGLVVWALRVRIKGLHADVRAEKTDRKAAEAAVKVINKQFDDHRLRAEAKEARLTEELERLEDERLESIEKIEDPVERVRRRRGLVASVLSKASALTGDHGQDVVPEDPAP